MNMPSELNGSRGPDQSFRAICDTTTPAYWLFVVFSGLLLVLGSIFLYDAFTHPPTADAVQVLIGSVCLAFCFLVVFFLVWESR
jgi:uncharacterized membrane protein